MLELLYSEYIEKNGLHFRDPHDRTETTVYPGCTIALNEKNELIRYTHSRGVYDQIVNGTIGDNIDEELKKHGQPAAQVVARVPYPLAMAEVSKNGKLTVIDEKLWLKHCGELPNCYDVKGSGFVGDFSPTF